MLYVEIPTSSDLLALTSSRDPSSVTLYLPSTPITAEADAARIELKNMARDAIQQLEQRGNNTDQVQAIEQLLHGLADDSEFWRYQANSLAVFVTPDHIRSYRLPTTMEPQVHVSDRFQLAQLLRAVTFPNAGYVLLLTEGESRLIEVSADLPASKLDLPDMPTTSEPFIAQPLADRMPRVRAQGVLGDASAQRQFARSVNSIVRDHLRGSGLPLVLAASEPMASIYRTINTYPRLADTTIEATPSVSDTTLAQRARPVFDAGYSTQLEDWRALFEERENQGKGTTDVASAARAATYGAVQSIMIDMTATMDGVIGEDGSVTFADEPGPDSYDVLGEIAARVIHSSGTVLAVRTDDIPNGAPLAAILRYAV